MIGKLIINPNADFGRAAQNAERLKPIILAQGLSVSFSERRGHVMALARQAAEEGYPLVIAGGGDGTVHEVLNGLMAIPKARRPKMGVAPLGSGNDFAFALGVDPDPAKALQRAIEGSPRKVDVGRVRMPGETGFEQSEPPESGSNEIYFGNALGIGFDATATIHSRKITWVHGFLPYLIAVLKTILLNHDAPLMQIRTDQETWEDRLLMLVVCNGPREGGGFLVAPGAAPDDQQFNYACIRKVSRPMMIRLLPEVMNGTHGRFKQVRMGALRRMELQADSPIFIHTDGEIIAGFDSYVRSLQIEMLPGELEVSL